MRLLFFFFFIYLLAYANSYSQKKYYYPLAVKDTVMDVYFGTEVADDYRYLENSENKWTVRWLEEQAMFAKRYKRKLFAYDDITSWLYNIHNTDFDVYEKAENRKEDEMYLFKRGKNNFRSSPDLFYKNRNDGFYKPLIRAKNYRRFKGDNILYTSISVDDDEQYVAVQISHSGSDWREMYVFDLASGEQVDVIRHIRQANVAWRGDGFYYIRYDAPEKGKELLNVRTGQRLCYHKVKSRQEEDKVLFFNQDRENKRTMSFDMMDSTKMVLTSSIKTQNKWFKVMSIVDITTTDSFLPKNFLAVPDTDVQYKIEAIFGDSVIIRSNLGSPKHRVLVCDKSKMNKISELIPEYENNLTEVNRLGKDKLACLYNLDGVNTVLIFDLGGRLLKTLVFPEGTSASGFYAKEDREYCYYRVKSFFHPDLRYKMDLKTLKSKPMGKLTLKYDYTRLKTEYVKYKSKDGTEIPMYLTYAKRLKRDSNNPTLIYGYGGYGTTISPGFSQEYIIWLLNGGILAIPNVRGGGAGGSHWAEAGRGLNKQNAIDDFIYAAKFLQQENYTSSALTAITGGSHGGMLVGAALTQEPALYKAAISSAGIHDMLRFEKFTVGNASSNLNEFGSVTDSLEFQNLYSYSPIHNIKEGVVYPSVLVITGDNDDRVPPFHSYKFVATLQAKGRVYPYILKVKQGTGHQSALTVEDYINDISFRYNFLFKELGIKLRDRVHSYDASR